MRGDDVILWDFDGTLAHREGLWSGCMGELLDEVHPGHRIDVERIRRAMRGRYLWNTPEDPHLHLCEPEAWWAEMEARMCAALAEIGMGEDAGADLARAMRGRLTDTRTGWKVFADTLPALDAAKAAGYRNAILSNHIPELAGIVERLGLGGSVEAVFSSAVTGYEKPHREAFRTALAALGDPGRVWMVGDNPTADVAGAEALGIPAILVRRDGEVRRRAEDLKGAVEIILAGVRR